MALRPRRLGPDDPDLPAVLKLIRDSFAYMDGIVDPPSSTHRLTLAALRAQAETGEVWTLGTPPIACALICVSDGALYIGKLSVAESARGQGLSRQLIDHAADRAKVLALDALTLQSRVELIDNHAAFRAMGFRETGRTAHEGFSRPTSITFRRSLR